MSSAARRAYETLEPFHLLAYFNPGIRAAQEGIGLDGHAFYIGARAAPLGPCDSSVVAAAFYNFSPTLIGTAWAQACTVGLGVVDGRRNAMLDEQFAAILGDTVNDPLVADLAGRYRDLAASLPLGGRALASGWASATVPDSPILALWHHIAVLREWRGDNHIATLVVNGLDGIDACTFHEADLLDPTVKRRSAGRRITQLTRGWSDEAWDASVDRLVDQGLVERTDSDTGVGHALTPEGAARYDDMEALTDALGESVWAADGVAKTLEQTRPLVKAVIDAGVLPGTRKK